ncbi:MAG: outer membrane beta-barrel protein [Crocinitomicaceae bacterium]|nr:outer membrane beta-barrel protein [Crocinitomicaceae bacterium]
MMNIRAFLFLLLVSYGSPSFAQNGSDFRRYIPDFSIPEPKIEINAGYNLSTFSIKINDLKVKPDFRSGFNIGIMIVDLPIGARDSVRPRFAFEFGIAFSSTGASYSATGTSIDSIQTTHTYDLDRDTKLYNFLFPFIVKQRFGYKRVQFYLDYGVFFQALGETHNSSSFHYTQTSNTGESVSESFEFNGEFDEGSDLEIYEYTYDLGFILGLGIKINNQFRIGMSYSHGLFNQASPRLRAANAEYFLYDTNYKNRVLSFNFGYIINPRRKKK